MQRRTISASDFLIGAHTTAYVLFSGLLFLGTLTYGFYQSFSASPILPMYLIWTAAFIMHGWTYFLGKVREAKAVRGSTSIQDERQAYRDGFNDAVRMIRDGQDMPNRLMIDDDGELIDERAAGKRKYR